MSGLDRIQIATDDLFTLRGLRDAINQTYINDATVDVTIYDKDPDNGGVALSGMTWPLTLVYIAASNGDYQGTIASTLDVEDGDTGVAVIDISGASLTRQLKLDVVFVTGDEADLAWSSRKELELMFGVNNVSQWADMNNNQVAAEITERIQWAIDNATDDARGRLVDSPVKLSTLIDAPLRLRVNVTRLAGVLLYESRGIKDTDETDGKHKLTNIKKQADLFFQRVQLGQQRIGEGATTTPGVVKDQCRRPDSVYEAYRERRIVYGIDFDLCCL